MIKLGGFMEFKITEAEAREMAKLEEESGCDISAGPDWGIHLDKVMALGLHSGEHNKYVTTPMSINDRSAWVL
jgi:hypothetical protein